MKSPTPRERMILAAASLFQREGYRATSWRKLVQQSGAPWGSAHHYFPGGKEQLAVAAIDAGAQSFLGLIEHVFREGATATEGIRELFTTSGTLLADSGFCAGCPVAPVALETAPASQALTEACQHAFGLWEDSLAAGLERTHLEPDRARALAGPMLSMFEGALMMARVQQSLEPMHSGAELLAELFAREDSVA